MTDVNGFIFEGILATVVSVFGILGNITAIIYFRLQRSRLQTFQTLLQMLSIFDLIFLMCTFIVFTIPKFYKDYDYTSFPKGTVFFAQPYLLPLAEIGLTGSIYFTIAISIERYVVICRPFLHLTRSLAPRFYIIPTVCFSILFNIPHFFEWKIERMYVAMNPEMDSRDNDTYPNHYAILEKDDEKNYFINSTDFRRNERYYKIYWVGLTICFGGIIPYAALIILNTLVVRALVRNRHTPNSNAIEMSVKRRLSAVRSTNSIIEGKLQFNSYENTFRIIHGVKESRRRKTQIDLAKLTIIIVAIFIFCHSVKWIPNIYELMVRFTTYYYKITI